MLVDETDAETFNDFLYWRRPPSTRRKTETMFVVSVTSRSPYSAWTPAAKAAVPPETSTISLTSLLSKIPDGETQLRTPFACIMKYTSEKCPQYQFHLLRSQFGKGKEPMGSRDQACFSCANWARSGHGGNIGVRGSNSSQR